MLSQRTHPRLPSLFPDMLVDLRDPPVSEAPSSYDWEKLDFRQRILNYHLGCDFHLFFTDEMAAPPDMASNVHYIAYQPVRIPSSFQLCVQFIRNGSQIEYPKSILWMFSLNIPGISKSFCGRASNKRITERSSLLQS